MCNIYPKIFPKDLASKTTENDIIENIKIKINQQIAELKKVISDNDLQSTSEYLQNSYNINKDNIYMYLHGHDLEDTVITALLNWLCYDFINNKIEEYDELMNLEAKSQ